VQYQRAAQLTIALSAADTQSTQLQQQLAQATAQMQRQAAQMQVEAKPDLPLSIGFRRAILGTGLVMELRNNAGSELEVAAVFISGATDQTQRRNLVLAPSRVVQFGSAEGWAFVPGQRIAFSNVNYRPAEIVVPASN
jgi:hypothetical protein